MAHEVRMLMVLWLVLSGTDAYAQASHGAAASILERPARYNLPTEETDLSPTDEVMPFLPWAVYSDRADNPTYIAPGAKTIKARLPFLGRYWVTEEREAYLRIAEDAGSDGVRLSGDARDMGWIAKNRLLLWTRCLATVKERMNRKAMIVNTVKYRPRNERDAQWVRFSASPEAERPTPHRARLRDIFFVYKETDEAVLLGATPRLPLDPSERYGAIAGWAPKSRTMPWNYRVFLEPDWEKAAAAERRRGRTARVFITPGTAMAYQRGEAVDARSEVWNDDPLDRRASGEWLRFPVIPVPVIPVRTGANGAPSSIVRVGLIKDHRRSDGLWYQVFTSALSAPLTVDGQEHPLFKYVLLLSREELGDMLMYLEALSEAMEGADSRRELLRAWMKIARENQPDRKITELIRRPLAGISESVFGLPPRRRDLTGLRLADIMNAGRFPRRRLNEYRTAIQASYERLDAIFQADAYPYAFRSNGIPYYWIEQDLLP